MSRAPGLFSIYLMLAGILVVGCGSEKSLKSDPEKTSEPSLPTVVQTSEGLQIHTLVNTQHHMVLIPAGPFTMGSNNGIRNEGPAHLVHLNAFYIDKTEVSNAQWNAYAIANHRRNNLKVPEHPAVNISWFQADEYCKWLGGRLPTEAEWEKAARGNDERTFPWGNQPDTKRANHLRSRDPFDNGTTPVGYFDGTSQNGFETLDGRSPFGLQDMAGNVWEWVQDEYAADYYARSPENNPVNFDPIRSAFHIDRVLRGGSWFNTPFLIRTTARFNLVSTSQGETTGFRCVRNAP